MKLLFNHVYDQILTPQFAPISTWKRQPQEDIFEYFQQRKVPLRPKPRLTTYVFFDDAQDTYSDNDLWNTFLKDVESTNFRVVLFCSYGSPAAE